MPTRDDKKNTCREGNKELMSERNYRVITLCGSTRFRNEFYRTCAELTLDGNVVIMPGVFVGHAGDAELYGIEYENSDTKKMLDEIHKQKIDMCDAICVINKDGYVGESTRNEIEYAKKHNKEVLWMDEAHIPSAYVDALGEEPQS